MHVSYDNVSYSQWAEGEPDGSRWRDDCVAMDTDKNTGEWLDEDCEDHAHYACKIDISMIL